MAVQTKFLMDNQCGKVDLKNSMILITQNVHLIFIILNLNLEF